MSDTAPIAAPATPTAPVPAVATPVDTSRAALRQMAVEGRTLSPPPESMKGAPDSIAPPVLTDEDRVAKLERLVAQDNRNRREADRVRQEKAAVTTEREAWKAEQAALATMKEALGRKDYRAAMRAAAGGDIPADEWLAMLQATAEDGEAPQPTAAEIATAAARAEIERHSAALEAARVEAEEKAAADRTAKVETSLHGYLEQVTADYSPQKYPALEKFVAITSEAISERFKAGMARGLALTPAELFAEWEAETVAKIDEFRPPPAVAPPWTPRLNLSGARDSGGAPPQVAQEPSLAEKRAHYRRLAEEATRK